MGAVVFILKQPPLLMKLSGVTGILLSLISLRNAVAFELSLPGWCDIYDSFYVTSVRRSLTLFIRSTDVGRSVCLYLLFSKTKDKLLGFVDAEQQAVLSAALPI